MHKFYHHSNNNAYTRHMICVYTMWCLLVSYTHPDMASRLASARALKTRTAPRRDHARAHVNVIRIRTYVRTYTLTRRGARARTRVSIIHLRGRPWAQHTTHARINGSTALRMRTNSNSTLQSSIKTFKISW